MPLKKNYFQRLPPTDNIFGTFTSINHLKKGGV